MLPNKLGTCCQILDANGKQLANTVIGTVQQKTLDTLLSGECLKNSPEKRSSLLCTNLTGVKKCRDKVTDKVKQNLSALLLQLKHISRMPDDCKMFRISSNLLPVFDHPQYNMLYDDKLKTLVAYGLKLCKRVISEHNIIVSAHPDHFVKIDSDNEQVRLKSYAVLEYHRHFLEQLTTAEQSCINIHVTGKLDHLPELDQGYYTELRKWLSFENDATVSRAGVLGTLDFCQRYNIKMVYDLHHDFCEHTGTHAALNDDRIMASIINTWQGQTPIFHVSDTKPEELERINVISERDLLWLPIVERKPDYSLTSPAKLNPHSDYINSPNVIIRVRELLEIANIDIEAKEKNRAVLDLRENLLNS